MPDTLLSVIIVSFNTRDLLRCCLESIVESPYHVVIGASGDEDDSLGTPQTPPSAAPWTSTRTTPSTMLHCEIIVVDNASRDGSAEMVEREFPGVRLILPGENLGFARATNLGIKASRGNLLLLLNPDTEVVDDALPTLAQFLSERPCLAAASPALVFPDGRPQHGAFRFPTLWMSFFDFFPLNHRLANSRWNGRYKVPEDGRAFPVDHPLGAAMMIRREAIDDVGLLDESFFMYCEEVDWCLRAKKRGWQIYQIPSARVVHYVAQSTGQFRESMMVELHRSRYRLFRKHYSKQFVLAHRAITRLGLAREWAKAWWLAQRGAITRDELVSRLRAYLTIWKM